MEGEFAIRKAKPGDFVEVEKLIHALFPQASPAYSEKDVYFVAEAKGGFCGFAHARLLGSSIMLAGLGVLPAHRRRGLGKALVSRMFTWAERTHPQMPVKLRVRPGNTAAISLYLKEGFMMGQDDGMAFKLVRQKPN